MIRIAPSILSADFSRLGEEVKAAEEAGAHMIHVDVMDGHFVPNITIGSAVLKSISKVTKLPLDVHLMIEDPDRYLGDFAEAGADILTVHYEVCRHLHRTIQRTKELGVKAGVTLNPATPIWNLENILPDVDMVLVMSVNPGFGGQEFIPRSLVKIRELAEMRSRYNGNFRIAVDGGVDLENVGEIVRAGADILIAGTCVFHTPDPGAAVRQLQERAENALAVKV